jgi:hypothetical protein
MSLLFYISSSLLKKQKGKHMNLSKFNFESGYESVKDKCYKCYEFDPIPNLIISLV